MKIRSSNFNFLLFFIFCFTIRVAFLGQKNLWFDEIYSWHIISGSFSDIVKITSGDIHPPFYYFLLKLWTGFFTDSVFSMRLLSVLFSVAALFYIYRIAINILSEKEIYWLLLLFILSPLNIYYSQEVRMLSLNLLLNCAAVYSLLVYLRDFNKIFLLTFVILSILALYTHYFSLFILASEFLFLLIFYRKTKAFLIAIIGVFAIMLSYLPWLPIMFRQVFQGQSWRKEQNIIEVFIQIYIFIKDFTLGIYQRYSEQIIVNTIGVLVHIIVFIIIIHLFRKWKNIKTWPHFSYLILIVTILPILISVIISFRQWIEFFRYLSILVPFIIMSGIIASRELPCGWRRYAGILFLLFFLTGDYFYFKNDSKNNDYRQILYTIDANKDSSAILFVYPHYYSWMTDYYRNQNNLNIPPAQNWGWEYSMMKDSVKIKKPEIFWLIMDYASSDSNLYLQRIDSLKSSYQIIFDEKYKTIPNTVELLKFVRR